MDASEVKTLRRRICRMEAGYNTALMPLTTLAAQNEANFHTLHQAVLDASTLDDVEIPDDPRAADGIRSLLRDLTLLGFAVVQRRVMEQQLDEVE